MSVLRSLRTRKMKIRLCDYYWLTVLNHNKSPARDLSMESRQGFIVIGQTTMECGSSSS